MMGAGNGPRLDDEGTEEGAWAGWQVDRLAPLSIADYQRAVVVAPHPDDEILAAGGLMQHLASAGTRITVVGVTDGEGSHPRSPTVSPMALADRRARERDQALTFLGLNRVDVVRLALPDGGVAGAGRGPCERPVRELDECLAGLLGPGVLCVAPWEYDGHPDHDATGRACARAGAASGATLLSYLVWTWHWAAPGDSRVPWNRARLLPLSRLQRTRKRWATQAFISQIAPLSDQPGDETILTPNMLRHFDRRHEVFLT